MREKLEQACGITLEEFRKVILAKWARAPHAQKTIINYTFDLNSIPPKFKKDIDHGNTDMVMSSLSETLRTEVRDTLRLWLPVCGDNIEFNYVEKLAPNQRGITIIGCDKLNNANGLTHYDYNVAATGENYFTQALVCIPSTIRHAYDRRTIFHEIGHALGLDHTHEVETIKQRLMDTEQGLGCSVMGYPSILTSPVNHCTVTEYCADQHYAVKPGPMDKQICTDLYAFPALSQVRYFNTMFLGFLNGSMEASCKSLLKNFSFIHVSEKNADSIAMMINFLLRLSVQGTSSVENALVLCELINRIQQSNMVGMLKLMRTLAEITGLFMTLYQAYGNEKALNSALYLGVFLASNLGGAIIGEPIGRWGAYLTNNTVSALGSFWRWGVGKTTHTITSLRNSFFTRTNDRDPGVDDKPDNSLHPMSYSSC